MNTNLNDLKLLYWNCRSLKNKLDLLNHSNEYDIIIIVETWLKPKDHFNLKNFNIVRYDRCSTGGGLAIFVRNNIIFDLVDLNLDLDSLEILSILVNTNLGDVLIATCYRSPV